MLAVLLILLCDDITRMLEQFACMCYLECGSGEFVVGDDGCVASVVGVDWLCLNCPDCNGNANLRFKNIAKKQATWLNKSQSLKIQNGCYSKGANLEMRNTK